MKTGNQLKDEALDSHEQTKAFYILSARWGAVKIAKRKGFVTINEVRKHYPPPPDLHPSVMGAVLRGALFVHTGKYTRAQHPASHARMVGIYKLKEQS